MKINKQYIENQLTKLNLIKYVIFVEVKNGYKEVKTWTRLVKNISNDNKNIILSLIKNLITSEGYKINTLGESPSNLSIHGKKEI